MIAYQRFWQLRQAWDEQHLTMAQIARALALHPQTVKKWVGRPAFAVFEQLLAPAGETPGAFFLFGRNADAREGLDVTGDIPVRARDQSERVPAVGLHFLTVIVPVARPHHEVFDPQRNQPAVQHEAKRPAS